MKPWFFKSMKLTPKSSVTVDADTGEIVESEGTAIDGDGIIVPAGAEDISRGFQIGSYKCYCKFPEKPVVKNYWLDFNGTRYEILSPEFWDEKDIQILQVRPCD